MNNRIKELAVQAMTATTNKFSADREWSADEWRDFYDTKFAELIVKECMQVASPNYMSTPEDSVYYVEQAINRIAKHFGVEEK